MYVCHKILANVQFIGLNSLLSEYRSLLSVYRSLLSVYRSLLSVCVSPSVGECPMHRAKVSFE